MSDSANSGSTDKIWTASNVITIVRILLVPLFVAALLAPWPDWFGMSAAFSKDWKCIVAAAIFVLISCTDWLDGYLARSRGEVTDFGKFMDPLADKILVAAALIALVELGALPTWVVLVILAREFIVSGVRMMAASKGVVIAASMIGKFKTVFQMIAIVLFTVKDSHMIGDFSEALADQLWVVSWLVMLVAIGLTIASMVDYLVKARGLIGLGPSSSRGSQTAGAVGSSDGGCALCGEDDAADIGVDDAGAIAGGGRLRELASLVVETAREQDVMLATAESLTGGLIGATITAVPGSSDVFLGGVMSYSSDVKCGVLHVDAGIIESGEVVSAQCAEQMAAGARELVEADIAVSVTGIAGPGGAEPGKPVGTVWMGVSTAERERSALHTFAGSRDDVRFQTVEAALGAFLSEMGQMN